MMDMVITRPHFGPVKGMEDGGKQSLTVYRHWKTVLNCTGGRVRCAMHADHRRQSVWECLSSKNNTSQKSDNTLGFFINTLRNLSNPFSSNTYFAIIHIWGTRLSRLEGSTVRILMMYYCNNLSIIHRKKHRNSVMQMTGKLKTSS